MTILRTALCLVLVVAAPAAAQMTLTLTDGSVQAGTLAGIAADGTATWRTPEGTTAVPLDRVVSIEAGDAGAPPPGGFKLDLVSGDSIFGRLEDGSADDVRIRGAAGDALISLDDIAVLWNREFHHGPESLPKAERDTEVLYIDRQGRIDSIPGVIERISKSEVVFSSAAGEKRPFLFSQDRVVAIRVASDPRAAAASRPGARLAVLRLKDGSRLTGAITGGDAASVSLDLVAGPKLQLDLAQVQRLVMMSGSFAFLSDLEPSAFEETPLIGGTLTHGYRKDAGISPGEPLRIGRQVFPRGLLLFARSRIAYPLDGTFKRFSARVGVDPATRSREIPGAAKVTVLVDGKPAWTSAVLRSGQPPVTVEVDTLTGAREIALLVEFADSFDAGARVVFGNAMILK